LFKKFYSLNAGKDNRILPKAGERQWEERQLIAVSCKLIGK
jgi:hypothetical protein